tara:strand:+ start:64 stop:312 length:249 start_codon:yes stop_codon:yes gene_type:complete
MTIPTRLKEHKIETAANGRRSIKNINTTLEEWTKQRPDLFNFVAVADTLNLDDTEKWQFISLGLLERLILTEKKDGSNKKTD